MRPRSRSAEARHVPTYSELMPTVPPQPAPRSESEPHRHRQVAESFGVDPARYDRTRPRHPDAMVERIVAASPGPDVLDVGCGTGIEARQFQAAGCKVLGVEPDARMAQFALRSGAEVEVATFEDWDPAGRNFDAVVAGQAWHWVDPVAGAAKAAHGDSTGSGPTPGTSGWTSCPPSASSLGCRRTSWRRCWRASEPRSTPWGAASRRAMPRCGHRGANRSHQLRR
jgi:hypothetical protein